MRYRAATLNLRPIDLGLYVLDGHEPVHIPYLSGSEDSSSLLSWAELFERIDRRIFRTRVHNVDISTVFLGLDHNHMRDLYPDAGPPILFESMVFGGPLDGEMDRYSTWDEAVEGHWRLYWDVRRHGSGEPRRRMPKRLYRKAVAEGRAA